MSYDMSQQQQQQRQQADGAKYKGVRKRKWGKWVSEIRLPNSRERIWLGSYDAPEKAARAFDAAQFCLRGPTAKFNFPASPPDIAGGMSLTPAEIQVAAARFANSATAHFSSPPSPAPSSVSGGTVQLDIYSEMAIDDSNCFVDMLERTTGPSLDYNVDYNVAEYGIFPGFDDLSCDFLPQPLPSSNDYVEDINSDWFSNQESLWNF